METSFKRSHAHTAALSAPDPAAGHHQPMPLLETTGHSQASLGQSLVGSLLLYPGPGLHKVLSVPSKSLFPHPCVSSEVSMVGLMPTSSKRLMAHPGLLHPEPPPLWQATAGPQHCRRHSKHLKAGLTQSLMCTRFCLSPLSISGEYGVSF